MARTFRKGPGRLTAGCAALIACGALDAHALALGEARVRSALGDPLDLRVAVTLAAGESIEPGCFSIVRDPAADIPRVTGGRVSIERSAAGTFVRIDTRVPVNEPAFVLGVVASCPGISGESRRDYSLLLDPPANARTRPSQAAARPQPETASLRAIAATLIARIGDTLESIAHAIFPRNQGARKAYLEALRDTNPTLAGLGDNDPIPIDTPIALPDLRTFARSRPPRVTQLASEPGASHRTSDAAPARPASRHRAPAKPAGTEAEPAPRIARSPPPRITSAPASAATTAPAPASTPATAPAKAPSPRTGRGDGFALRLSSGDVDLTRSRGMDERKRAQLRDRQLVLDQDDQVAALLALKHSVKQLEGRVAELQLKLASMPTSFPAPRAETPPAAPPNAPAKVEAPPPPKIEAPKAEAPPAPPPIESPPPKAEAPAPAPKAEAPAPAPKAEPAAAAKAQEPPTRRTVTDEEWIRYGLWVLAVLLLFAAGYLAWRLWMRRRAAATAEEEEELPPPAAVDDRIVVADEHHVVEAEPAAAAARADVTADGRRIIDADVELPTRLANDTDDLRRRYIEERFPEVTKGAIVLDEPDSVVKGARLFYEDGNIARAVELLQYAIERRPGDIKVWLALFEIFRLERLTGEFSALAARFKDQHGASPYWPKVQYFGREIDPGNALYQQPILDRFETIGPAQARRIAAESSFDPIAENWLGAPMDFQNEVLANELRKAVMAEAGISESDLLPNPMPALRNVEMFTVA